MSRSRRLTPARRADLIARFRAVATGAELTVAFGITAATVRYHTRGIARSAAWAARIRALRRSSARHARSFGTTLPPAAEQIALIDQWTRGIPNRVLRAHFGVSDSTIRTLTRDRSRSAPTSPPPSVTPHVSAPLRTPVPGGATVPPKRSTWIPDLLGSLQRGTDGVDDQLLAGSRATRPHPGAEQHAIAATIGASLEPYVTTRRLGRVYAAPWCILSRFPATVLACELAFVRATRAGAWDGYIPLVPDLVVEVLPRSQRYLDVVDRVDVWLAAGTRLVLIVNARMRSIGLHTAQGAARVAGRHHLSGGDVARAGTCRCRRCWRLRHASALVLRYEMRRRRCATAAI